MSQERNNRSEIIGAIQKYMEALPEPKEMPTLIEVRLLYPGASEFHKIEIREEDAAKEERVRPEKIAELYNRLCKNLPQVRLLSETRKKAIRARTKEYDTETFRTLFTKANASAFLTGKNPRGWVADFDWLIKPANIPRVLEGYYDNREKKENGMCKSSFDVDVFLKKALQKGYGGNQ